MRQSKLGNEETRQQFIAAYNANLTHRQICDLMGVSMRTVLLWRARLDLPRHRVGRRQKVRITNTESIK